ncbi:MAG: hypothetical protein WC455_23305 [Dehalococcoidia bacterium]
MEKQVWRADLSQCKPISEKLLCSLGYLKDMREPEMWQGTARGNECSMTITLRMSR